MLTDLELFSETLIRAKDKETEFNSEGDTVMIIITTNNLNETQDSSLRVPVLVLYTFSCKLWRIFVRPEAFVTSVFVQQIVCRQGDQSRLKRSSRNTTSLSPET